MDDATGRVRQSDRTARGAVAAPVNERIDPTLPAETDERAKEIRQEIAQTREDMGETIEAIQDRLKPSTIVANATETVKNATTEKVKQMANTAGEAADRVMNNTFMDTIRDNPWPVAMIGFGAAWLWMKGRSSSETYRTGRYGYGNYPDQGESGGRYDWKTRTSVSGEDYEYMEGTNFGESSRDTGAAASEYADTIRSTARRTTRRAQNSFDRVLRENPLALGAAATIVGAAIGMTMPSTDVENEWMGETRDSVVDRAREMASEAAEKVQSTAEQVKDAASRAVEATKPDSKGSSAPTTP
jgi:gas vesicle protein